MVLRDEFEWAYAELDVEGSFELPPVSFITILSCAKAYHTTLEQT